MGSNHFQYDNVQVRRMSRKPVFHRFHQYTDVQCMFSAIKILIKLLAIYRTLKVTPLSITQHLGECSTSVTQWTSQSNAILSSSYIYMNLLNKLTGLQTCLACFVYWLLRIWILCFWATPQLLFALSPNTFGGHRAALARIVPWYSKDTV